MRIHAGNTGLEKEVRVWYYATNVSRRMNHDAKEQPSDLSDEDLIKKLEPYREEGNHLGLLIDLMKENILGGTPFEAQVKGIKLSIAGSDSAEQAKQKIEAFLQALAAEEQKRKIHVEEKSQGEQAIEAEVQRRVEKIIQEREAAIIKQLEAFPAPEPAKEPLQNPSSPDVPHQPRRPLKEYEILTFQKSPSQTTLIEAQQKYTNFTIRFDLPYIELLQPEDFLRRHDQIVQVLIEATSQLPQVHVWMKIKMRDYTQARTLWEKEIIIQEMLGYFDFELEKSIDKIQQRFDSLYEKFLNQKYVDGNRVKHKVGLSSRMSQIYQNLLRQFPQLASDIKEVNRRVAIIDPHHRDFLKNEGKMLLIIDLLIKVGI